VMTNESTAPPPLVLPDHLWPPSASMADIPRQALANVALAHALRTPLTVIRGQSQLLRWWADRPGALNLSAILQSAARIEEATRELAAAIEGLALGDVLRSDEPTDTVIARQDCPPS
jgi:signal transduction histidine kinase